MFLANVRLSTIAIVEGKDLKLVDAPVSGGVKRASMGELTVRKDLSFKEIDLINFVG